LIEGKRELGRAVAAGIDIETLFVSPDLAGDVAPIVERLAEGSSIVTVGAEAFGALSRRQNPDGVTAVAVTPPHRIGDIDVEGPSLVLIVEHIEKPGNLGAMLRTADGAGATAVVSADPGTDFENPNVIRASQGSVFAVSVAAAGRGEVVSWLRAKRLDAVALVPDGTRAIWDIVLGSRAALIVGSESEGLSAELAAAARSVSIPMRGAADSLNVSVAAAIGLYEAVRQRSHA